MDWDNVDLLIVFWETILFDFLFPMNILINSLGVAVRSRCLIRWGYDDVDVNYIGQFNIYPRVTPSPHPYSHTGTLTLRWSKINICFNFQKIATDIVNGSGKIKGTGKQTWLKGKTPEHIKRRWRKKTSACICQRLYSDPSNLRLNL
jgi:hypothetical protein